jgi:hypothetical protein
MSPAVLVSQHRGVPSTVREGVAREPMSRAAQVPPPVNPAMNKHKILFLAAHPLGTDRLAFDQEAHAIQIEVERSGHRDCFELVTRWAVEPLDLLRELRKLRPTVVHFSGHGCPAVPRGRCADQASHRDVVEHGHERDELQGGLLFQGPDGRAQRVSTEALRDTFSAAGSSVQVVVLSACYSAVQAEALRTHVDCVVGIGSAIRDDVARSFAIGFYGGLGERESVAAAFRQGCAAIRLRGLPHAERPQLAIRDGVDAEQLVLAADLPVHSPEAQPRQRVGQWSMNRVAARGLVQQHPHDHREAVEQRERTARVVDRISQAWAVGAAVGPNDHDDSPAGATIVGFVAGTVLRIGVLGASIHGFLREATAAARSRHTICRSAASGPAGVGRKPAECPGCGTIAAVASIARRI